MSSSGVITSNDDLVVYVSCISGVLGTVLVFAVVGFILENIGCFKTKPVPREMGQNAPGNNHETLQNQQHDHENGTCGNHYPAWMYKELASSQHQNMEAVARPVETKDSQDPISYVNEVFSDIISEHNGTNGGLVVPYEKTEEKVKKEKSPGLFIAYKKKNQKKQKKEDSKKNKLKVPMGAETTVKVEDKKKPARRLAMDEYDPHEVRRKEEIVKAGKEKRKILISTAEDEMKKKARSQHHSQSIQYENPKVMAKERELQRQRDDKQKKEEEDKRKKRRIKVEQSQSNNRSQKKEVVERQRRIPTEERKKTAEELSQHDSFLY